MVEELHPHVQGEPGRRTDEELVSIGCDVPLPQVDHELRLDGGRIERRDIDTENDGNVYQKEDEVRDVAFAGQD